ncbi:MAG: hypothetical protein PHP50_09340 [Lachnospiraceae bacterium]|nr:hypothetical protein [Lachnospiraceae bacterium]
MHNQIRKALDDIQAEEALKQNTASFLHNRIYCNKAEKQRMPWYGSWLQYGRLATVTTCLCLLLVVFGFGGRSVYMEPVSAISVDVNPSIELGINRWDRVVSVEGYNEDGTALAEVLQEQLNIKYSNYADALDTLINSEYIIGYLENDGAVSITVLGSDDREREKMLSCINACGYMNRPNVSCHAGNHEEAEEAHEHGMSFGKYRAFLELQKLDATVTVEDVQGLSMREIQDRIEKLGGNVTEDTIGNMQHEGGCQEQNSGHSHNGKH